MDLTAWNPPLITDGVVEPRTDSNRTGRNRTSRGSN
jgi:hypothetical protein